MSHTAKEKKTVVREYGGAFFYSHWSVLLRRRLFTFFEIVIVLHQCSVLNMHV